MVPTPESWDPVVPSLGQIPTKNFFAPLRTSEMDVERALREEASDNPNGGQQPSSNKSGRRSPIALTSTINLLQLQRHIKI
jgi:hypothetical protein